MRIKTLFLDYTDLMLGANGRAPNVGMIRPKALQVMEVSEEVYYMDIDGKVTCLKHRDENKIDNFSLIGNINFNFLDEE